MDLVRVNATNCRTAFSLLIECDNLSQLQDWMRRCTVA